MIFIIFLTVSIRLFDENHTFPTNQSPSIRLSEHDAYEIFLAVSSGPGIP